MQRIKVGDKVQITRGRDKPQTAEDRKKASGEITTIDYAGGKCTVAGKNMVWKHKKPAGPEKPGGRAQQEAELPLSGVMLFNEAAGRAERVGFRVENGKKVRYFKKSGTTIA